MSGRTCPRRNCGATLHIATDGAGHTLVVCDPCERNQRGLCRDCPGALPHRTAMRCKSCQHRRNLERVKRQQTQRYHDDPEWRVRKLAKQKEYHARPEVRKRMREYQREWLAADPGYHAVKGRKYRMSEHGRATARKASRNWYARNKEKAREYRQRYYAANREQLRAKQREREKRRRWSKERAA